MGAGDRKSAQPASGGLQGRSLRGPVDRLALPGVRVVRRCGHIPEGFPSLLAEPGFTCDRHLGISMDLAPTHS